MRKIQLRPICVLVSTTSLLSAGESVADQKPETNSSDEHHYFSMTEHKHEAN